MIRNDLVEYVRLYQHVPSRPCGNTLGFEPDMIEMAWVRTLPETVDFYNRRKAKLALTAKVIEIGERETARWKGLELY